jgi:lipase
MQPDRYHPITVPLPDVPDRALGGGEWEGSGYPILGVQGLTSNHRLFDLLARELPAHRLVAQDARGRASGCGVPCPDTLTTHADDLVRLLDGTGIDKAVVVGHSMGGFIALRLAQRHPDRVQGLVLVDGGPPVRLPGPLGTRWAVRAAFRTKLPKANRTWRDFDDLWGWLGTRAQAFDQLDPEWIRWAFELDIAGPPGAMRLQQDRPVLLEDAAECSTARWRAEALRTLSMPCHVVLAEWGANRGDKPLYRRDPDPTTLAPGTRVTRIAGTDHADALWHPRTVDAIAALVPA